MVSCEPGELLATSNGWEVCVDTSALNRLFADLYSTTAYEEGNVTMAKIPGMRLEEGDGRQKRLMRARKV